MEENKYWKGLEEKNQDQSFLERTNKEFPDELPLLSELQSTVEDHKGNRRDFLKMMGFSVGAAAVAASCEIPERKSIPYVFKPEEITPGMPTYYATTYYRDGELASVLVKTREGRPILAEPNKKSNLGMAGISSKTQATILSLYDHARMKAPYMTADGPTKATWEEIDLSVRAKLNGMRDAGDRVVLMTSTIASPSTQRAIDEFRAAYPNVEHVIYDTISYDGMLSANEKMHGERSIADVHLKKCNLLVGIGADFLANWPAPMASAYGDARRVNKENTNMMRHVQVESIPTVTGSNADDRIPVKPSEEAMAVLKLYKLLGGSVDDGGYENEALTALADELRQNRGKSAVVCGINDPNVQMVVNQINDMLGNYNKTMTFDSAYLTKSGSDAKLNKAVADIIGGSVKGVMIMDCNPCHTLPNFAEFTEAYKNLDFTLSLSERNDETTVISKYICPDNHYLESWNDLQPKKGVFATVQPTIKPLFETRQAQVSLLTWAGNNTDYYEYIREGWQGVYAKQSNYSSFDSMWDATVHDGDINVGKAAGVAVAAAAVTANDASLPEIVDDIMDSLSGGANDSAAGAGSVSGAATAILRNAQAVGGDNELKVYEKIAIGNGYIAESPWLQELPDPISKICWDNYLLANPKWVDENGFTPNYKNFEHSIVKVSNGTYSVEVPIIPQPGVPYGTFGIAFGYGKTQVNHELLAVGANASPFMTKATTGSFFNNVSSGITVEATGKSDLLAITQTNYNISGMTLGGDKTRFVVKETTLDDYKNDPWSGNHIMDKRRDKWLEHHLKSPYPDHDMGGHHWGMSIDLTTCTGCGACVTACHAENNVPMVGKMEVRRAHDMHWLRIDRYYIGDEDNPEVVFQPMLCQHCDNAPCENVCPVAATTHSSEGINHMAYNRCIGTRYCANNCPYKVRRFNWYDFQGADSFWGLASNESDPFTGRPFSAPGTVDDLTRMVLNPDVTVRSRGVMEKCSFCVQRTQYGKLEAKKEKRALQGDEINTACENACPANAITFGDTNDKDSHIHDLVFNDERTFGVIEEIHTLPSVTYMVKVRNKKEVAISKTVRTGGHDHA